MISRFPTPIEEEPRLLTRNQIDSKREAVSRRFPSSPERRPPPGRSGLTSPRADGNAPRSVRRSPPIRPHRRDGPMRVSRHFSIPAVPSAEHKKAAVMVDNEAGHPVPFCIDEAIDKSAFQAERPSSAGLRLRSRSAGARISASILGGRITGRKAEGDVAGAEKPRPRLGRRCPPQRTMSPGAGSPSTLATAPEKTQGWPWRRGSSPFLSMIRG